MPETPQSVDELGKTRVALIAALGAKTRAIGKNGRLLWHIPEDLKRFKALTSGHPVIMGRKTWESLPEKFRPLPNRTNIVVTRDPSYAAPGALVAASLDAALAAAASAPGSEEIFVIGGGELYTAALPFAYRLYLALVDSDAPGDAFFPEYEPEFTKILAEQAGESGGLTYRSLDLER
jgi:dihydrofolate reductase